MPIAVGLGERRNSCGCPPCIVLPCGDWPTDLKVTSVSNFGPADGQVITLGKCSLPAVDTWGFDDPSSCSNYDFQFITPFSDVDGPCHTTAGNQLLRVKCMSDKPYAGQLSIFGNVPTLFDDPLMWRPKVDPIQLSELGADPAPGSIARVFIDSVSPFMAHTEILYFTGAPHPSISLTDPTYLCEADVPLTAAYPWCSAYNAGTPTNCDTLNASAATLQFLIEAA